MTWTRHRLQMKTRPCEHIRRRQSGVNPDTELPDNGQEPGHHDRFSGCGAGVLAENRAGAASLSPTPFLHPLAGNRDPGSQDPLHDRTDNRAARTGRRRHHPFPAHGVVADVKAILEKAKPSSQTSRTGPRNSRIATIGSTQQDRRKWEKRGKPPRMPRIGSTANIGGLLRVFSVFLDGQHGFS